MTYLEESPEHPAFPERLTDALPVTLPLRVPVAEAIGRLRLAVDDREPVESGSTKSDRRLTGVISGESVRLSVEDEVRAHRRKGWRIQFLGHFEPATAPTVLQGTVDIANHRFIRPWLRFIRVAALVPLLLGIGSAFGLLRGSGSPTFALLFGLSLSLFASWAAFGVKDSIERAAADDARVLADYLRSRLR